MTKATKKVMSEIEKMTETETETAINIIIDMYVSATTLAIQEILEVI